MNVCGWTVFPLLRRYKSAHYAGVNGLKMAYFQVLLKYESIESEYEQVFSDLSEEELKSKFIKPYYKACDILVGGKVVKMSAIAKIMIVRTKDPDNQTRDIINNLSLNRISEMNRQSDSVVFISPGSGYDPEDILEAGEDVTSEYVNGPPGSGGTINWSYLSAHPMVVAVVGGLLLLGIAALLGLG